MQKKMPPFEEEQTGRSADTSDEYYDKRAMKDFILDDDDDEEKKAFLSDSNNRSVDDEIDSHHPDACETSNKDSSVAEDGIPILHQNDDSIRYCDIPTRALAIVTLILLFASHALLGTVCLTAALDADLTSQTFTTWRVLQPPQTETINDSQEDLSQVTTTDSSQRTTDSSQQQGVVTLHQNPWKKSESFDTLFPGEEVIIFGSPEDGSPYVQHASPKVRKNVASSSKHYMHVISPRNGWIALRDSAKDPAKLERNIFGQRRDSKYCPIVAAGVVHPKLARFNYAPKALVGSQILWNACQVFQLLVVVCLWSHSSNICDGGIGTAATMKMARYLRCGIVLLSASCIALLPYSCYVTSPGAHYFAWVALTSNFALLLLANRWSSRGSSSSTAGGRMRVCIVNEFFKRQAPRQFYLQSSSSSCDGSKKRSIGIGNGNCNDGLPTTPLSSSTSMRKVCKVETIAFFANLGCTMYNYESSKTIWPHWNTLYRTIDQYLGVGGGIDFNSKKEVFVRSMYTLGDANTHVPLYLPLAYGSTMGSIVYLVIWSILPILYVTYFASMYITSQSYQYTKCSRWMQQFLALFGIVHFLFLTDLVDYKYGRGMKNAYGEWSHWSERFAWRIAILLPIYQNVITGQWRRGSSYPNVGKLLHYFMMLIGVGFFVYQILLNDARHFPQFIKGERETQVLGWNFHGYHKVLLVMVFVYGFMAVGGSPCHHIYIGRLTGDDMDATLTKSTTTKRPHVL